MAGPVILEKIADLRRWRAERRAAGKRIGLVPTMGALHAGHLSLVTGVKQVADEALVSIFVNPTQFAPTEDFSKYPRTFSDDIKRLSEMSVEAVFAPQVQEMYPPGFATTVSLDGPAKVGLEDAFRPTHFAGVATVVTKLLLQSLPDAAIFGEKDFQQLAVIRRFVRDLDIPVEVLGGATLREADGLAMSSRNVYLTPEERAVAPTVHRVLQAAAELVRKRQPLDRIEIEAAEALTTAGFAVDYFAIRDARNLGAPYAGADPARLRLLVAAKLGKTRLIDNIAAG